MPIYNKLVRDRIPEIIEKQGLEFSSRILDSEEYVAELRKKVLEETGEYLSAQTNKDAVEELADVLEIIQALAEAHGASVQELERVRAEKAEKRGGFKERIYLIEVKDA
ncbi:nucleoside triphosphate pyrophosphohydrolase [Paenibacillus sp. NEAU-GSW1]|uniref:nucleoside triphosphate pyrophosphohydrolase n=1 Tax=Paenibacillus sp. NEAU-GSW1 TaxID=2682486 RepID=UPI0012E22BDD|nr:nucleoside triphosphate pyrophosphohydrolase [Paenibacillus sp. NEAU-GSW1]MUT65717.1 phosphoribosyl-ATP pyrophosphohydrolase [Paenibacillus sp. NEAU-GSW1]